MLTAKNPGITVLIIDDNQDLAEMYQLKLSIEGFHVEIANDGEQGLLRAVEVKPAIILIDLLMPNMNGFEVLKALKNNPKIETKIIVLSNLGQYENIRVAKSLGATEYMVKSNSNPTKVVNKIKEILGVSSLSKMDESEEAAEVEKDSDREEVIIEKLKKYESLLNESVITQNEFSAIKKKLVGTHSGKT
ncbi:response regulator [bacterium]|nr:response regulator [bacterium]